MLRYVFDTNIITAILRKEEKTLKQLTIAHKNNAEFLLCPVVFYEICRGLRYRDAKRQLEFFLEYAQTLIWDDFNQADWEQASQIWANLRNIGYQIADADLVIAVFAINRQAIVITDNEKHFEKIGVLIENWRR